jgi:hypothetical protein
MNLISTPNNLLNSLEEFKSNSNESSLSKKVVIEKRKRHQAYITIEYLLGFLTYFDFFSNDTFQIVKNSVFFSKLVGKNTITSDVLLISLLDDKFELSKVLKEYNLVQGSLLETFSNLENKPTGKNLFSSVFSQKSKTLSIDEKEIIYSQEMNQLFEKTVENALYRFKTPVVNPDLLFITFMEEKNSKAGKLIAKLLKTEANWYLLRYRLIKRLHSQEVLIRGEITKNQHYFAYLMKTRFSEFDFNKLIKNELLLTAVSFFRNFLVKDILKQNLFQTLGDDISNSIKINNKRKYS